MVGSASRNSSGSRFQASCYVHTRDLAQALLSRCIKFVLRSCPQLFWSEAVDLWILNPPILGRLAGGAGKL